MSLKIGEQSVQEKITAARDSYDDSVVSYKDAKFVLQKWDQYPDESLTEAERLAERDRLVQEMDDAKAAMLDAEQLLRWMINEHSSQENPGWKDWWMRTGRQRCAQTKSR